MKETGRIQADFSAHKKDLYKRGKALRALKTELASIKSGSGDAATEADVDEALELVVEAQKALCDVLSITPETGSLFTRLWLGRVNVRAPHKQDRLRLRDECVARDRMTMPARARARAARVRTTVICERPCLTLRS